MAAGGPVILVILNSAGCGLTITHVGFFDTGDGWPDGCAPTPLRVCDGSPDTAFDDAVDVGSASTSAGSGDEQYPDATPIPMDGPPDDNVPIAADSSEGAEPPDDAQIPEDAAEPADDAQAPDDAGEASNTTVDAEEGADALPLVDAASDRAAATDSGVPDAGCACVATTILWEGPLGRNGLWSCDTYKFLRWSNHAMCSNTVGCADAVNAAISNTDVNRALATAATYVSPVASQQFSQITISDQTFYIVSECPSTSLCASGAIPVGVQNLLQVLNDVQSAQLLQPCNGGDGGSGAPD
jgi:hypothetical protein